MKTRRNLTLTLLLGLCTLSPLQAQEEPLLTIACLSDCHAERSLIDQSDISKIKLRGSFEQTLKRIKKEENIDVMVLGGDCTSDATISMQNWMRVRELMATATRSAFPDEHPTPVLYATGNHDYEVANWDRLPKPYNAGDYYTFPMREDVGALDFDDAFYEQAPNGALGEMTLLAAYHYKVKGFDFVVLNCGKNFFASAWDYIYSEESVQWVANKLAQIYAGQPDKTVFFALHIPFGDSNSISSPQKGFYRSPGERLLKQTLSKYPNLIMLYGHDHGRNTAYSRRKTSQRVTHYDKLGHVIATTDATHVDGATQDPENDDNQFYLRNGGTQMFLGLDSYNLTALAARTAVTFTPLTNNAFSADVEILNGMSSKFVHVGTNARFSSGDPSNIYLYEVTSNADGIQASRVAHPEDGKTYLMVTQYNGIWYALSGELYSPGSAEQRLAGTRVTMAGNKQTLTVATNKLLEWTFESAAKVPASTTRWYVQNNKDQRYLGFNNVNLTTVDYENLVTMDLQSEQTKQFTVAVSGSGSEAAGSYIVSSTDGRFSCSTERNPTWIYRVDDASGSRITATRTTELHDGDQVIFVAQNQKNTNELYALTNAIYSASPSSCRLNGLKVTDKEGTITLAKSRTDLVWTLHDVPEAEPSFVSAFMGSMRYYFNTIDPGDMPIETPNIVQALMVYVYPDRVEMRMKNYNRSGVINNVKVNAQLAPYTLYRKVEVKDDVPDEQARLQAVISAAEAFDQQTSEVLQNALDEALTKARALVGSSDKTAQAAATAALSRALGDARFVDVSVLKTVYAGCQTASYTGDGMKEAAEALHEAKDMNAVNTAINTLKVGRKLLHAESHDYPFTPEVTAANKTCYLYNVGQHRFFCGGAKWGAHAALGWPGIEVTLKRISAANNSFAIDTHLGSGDSHWLNENAYCDHDASTYAWAFERQSNGCYVIRAVDSKLMLGFAPYQMLEGEYFYDHVAQISNGDTKDPNNQWMLVSREQRDKLLNEASEEHPIDASHYIKMPNFSQREYDEVEGGWDGSKGAWKHNTVGDAGNITISERGGCFPDFAFQCWNANPLNLTQQLNVPPGRYKVTLNGFYREGGKENHTAILMKGETPKQPAKVYANNSEIAVLPGIHEAANMLPGVGWKGEAGEWADVAHDAVEYFQNGCYFVESEEFEVGERGILTLAVKKNLSRTYDWTLVDNFRLICLGVTAPVGVGGLTDDHATKDTATYTLQGVQVQRPLTKGIYIVNGRKVVIR